MKKLHPLIQEEKKKCPLQEGGEEGRNGTSIGSTTMPTPERFLVALQKENQVWSGEAVLGSSRDNWSQHGRGKGCKFRKKKIKEQ